MPRGSVIAAVAFAAVLLFVVSSIYYSTQGLPALVDQLEGATDKRLKKSLLVNRMVTAGNRRALLLSHIAHIADPFERDQLLMEVYENGADFVAARSALVKLSLDRAEQQLLDDQSRVMQRLAPKVNQVIGLIQEEKLLDAHRYLIAEVLSEQGIMLGSLSQLGRYQQAKQYQNLSRVRGDTRELQQKIFGTGAIVVALVLLIGLVVRYLLVRGERERQNAYQQLEESNRKLSDSLQQLKETDQINQDRQYALDQSALVLMTDAMGKITYVNDRYCEVSGYRREELLGWTPKVFNSGHHDELFWRKFWEEIGQGEVVRREICNQSCKGEEFWISATVTPILDQGEPRGYLAIAFEITDRKWMEDELQQSHDAWRREIEQRHDELSQMAFVATHDSLTQLPNQGLFHDRLSHAIKRSQDDPDYPGFFLLQLDLINFRMVNEGLGSKVGDQLLIQVAARIKKMLPASATVARLSGKKFAIFREETSEHTEESSDLVQLLLSRLEAPFQVGEHLIHLEVALGVVFYPDDGEEADQLLTRASAALHKAAEQAERYVYYKHEHNEMAQRHALFMSDLRQASERGEFELHYQPKVSASEGEIQGAEALIRWNHPERGCISPVEFVPLLESSGLIHSVGRWVLRTACQQAKRWIEQRKKPLHVAVNITVSQLQSSAIVEDVRLALELAELPAECLELEITESHYMDRMEHILKNLMALRELGVQIAIDDFGTGHSSLAYLLHLPVDTLKIDKCFIDHIPDNQQDLFLVETILGIGERLGLKVVAEGVEHSKQLEWLRQQACDEIQGFYYSPPLSVSEMEHWVEERSSNH